MEIVHLIFLAELDPLFLEDFGSFLKSADWVIVVNIVFFEVLHEHQNEKIEHYVLDHDDVNNEDNFVDL